ncbi:hypothetical protein AO282_26265 [Pseudomonas amygdali pv. morsprunorum]|nr:hypothetical protein AO282_26265 [Pseudomonas amygdali pv. morsprunorum]
MYTMAKRNNNPKHSDPLGVGKGGMGFELHMPGTEPVIGQPYAKDYRITVERCDGIAPNESEVFVALNLFVIARAGDERPFQDEMP